RSLAATDPGEGLGCAGCRRLKINHSAAEHDEPAVPAATGSLLVLASRPVTMGFRDGPGVDPARTTRRPSNGDPPVKPWPRGMAAATSSLVCLAISIAVSAPVLAATLREGPDSAPAAL